nr:PREDICTED: THUMP domain-containing protein 1 homolog [Bemisia tabaci]
MMPKRKNFYRPQTHKKGKFCITPGLKGFICTCNIMNEKECVRESYNIMNEFSAKLFPEMKEPETAENVEASEVEDELAKEIEELKSSDDKTEQRKFSVVNTDIKGVVFIKTTLDDPVKLAHSILAEIADTKQQRTRFLLRMIPVEAVCRATVEDIKAAAVILFKKHFKCDSTTFSIIFNRRQNDNIDRMELVRELALLVTDCNPLHQANLKEPNLAVVVEVIRGICCLSVVPDYYKLRKYNLLELTNPTESGKKAEEKDTHSTDTENSEKKGDGSSETTATNDVNPDLGAQNPAVETTILKDEKER